MTGVQTCALPISTQTKACAARKVATDLFTPYKSGVDKIMADEAALEKGRDKEALKHDPERIFKMKYCASSDLMATLYYFPKPIQSNCIYLISDKTARFVVIQSIDGGVLAAPPGNGYIVSKAIFVKTSKQYADGDPLPSQYLKSMGLKKYTSVEGVGKTVNSFQYLGDVDSPE